MRLQAFEYYHCPVCGAELHPEGRQRLDCPDCGTTLIEARSSAYGWPELVVCYGVASLIAWKRGWEPSFIVFVVSFYAIPVFIVWQSIKRTFFPPKSFRVAPSRIQKLGL